MGNRLLLADDSITIQKVVAIIFANEEFELTVVDNGTAALEKAREIQPEVMLVDALMPGKTGYEVCSEIRRDPKLSSVPILLLIGAFEPLDEDKARSCGADATISKPFESQQLIDKVKELLELGKNRKSAAPAAPAAQAPQPEPAAKGAEDIWGDLSALDTMAPAAPKAAPVQPAPQPQAAPQKPQAAPQPPPAAPPQAAPKAAAPVEEEIVEASFEDDLWGAFDLEEEEKAPAAAPSEVFGVVEPEGEYEAEQFFTFEDDEAIEETGPALELVEEPIELPAAELEPEELFSFDEEIPAATAAPAAPAAEPEPFELPEYEPFSIEEEPAELEPFAPEPVEPEPMQPAAAAWAETAPLTQQAAPQPTAPPTAAAAPALTEEALVQALSKISRDVIERIVWEVVPDLAEVLIKEEIKKLRAGSKG